MVCQRCIFTVRTILEKLNIPFDKISLGEAILKRPLKTEEHEKLRKEFEKVGFEIILDKDQKIINDIKSIIIEEVYSEKISNRKLSAVLTSKLHFDYSHITHVFTEIEGQTIQKYYNAVRIERAKELLDYNEIGIAEIADRLGYSTPAYLSTSFKNSTGYTPSEYKNLEKKERKRIDAL